MPSVVRWRDRCFDLRMVGCWFVDHGRFLLDVMLGLECSCCGAGRSEVKHRSQVDAVDRSMRLNGSRVRCIGAKMRLAGIVVAKSKFHDGRKRPVGSNRNGASRSRPRNKNNDSEMLASSCIDFGQAQSARRGAAMVVAVVMADGDGGQRGRSSPFGPAKHVRLVRSRPVPSSQNSKASKTKSCSPFP